MRDISLERLIVESLLIYIKNLNEESRNGALVVVEGKRDVRALRGIGFNGKIFMLCHNNTLIKLIDEARKFSKIILLFDLDRKGRSLTKKSFIVLEAKKNIVDLSFRRQLTSLTRGKVIHIEELNQFRNKISEASIDILGHEKTF